MEEPADEEPAAEESEEEGASGLSLSVSLPALEDDNAGAEYDGTWNLVQVERGGQIILASQLGLSGTLVVTGSSASYTMDADTLAGMVTYGETGMTVVTRGGSMKFTLNGEGFLCRNTLLDGDSVVLRFYQGEAPALPTPAATQPAAVTPASFEGHWRGENAQVLGMAFTLEELGLGAVELEISGNTCFLTDENGRREVSLFRDGARLIFTDGALRWVFRFDGQGQALLEMNREGVSVQVVMTILDGMPAAQ